MDPKGQNKFFLMSPETHFPIQLPLKSTPGWVRAAGAFTDCVSLRVPSGRGRLCWQAQSSSQLQRLELHTHLGIPVREECPSCSTPCHGAVQGFSSGLFLLKLRNSSWVTFLPASTCHSESLGLNMLISFPNMTFCSLGVSRKASHGSSFCRLGAAGAGIKKKKACSRGKD